MDLYRSDQGRLPGYSVRLHAVTLLLVHVLERLQTIHPSAIKGVVFEFNFETDLVGYHESIATPSIRRNWPPVISFYSPYACAIDAQRSKQTP